MEPVLSSAMCRCCASEGTFKDIHTKYHWMGDEEVYSVMLKECFDITLSSPQGDEGGICEVCITQLRNASNFKKQVLHTEEQFQQMLDNRVQGIKIEYTKDSSEEPEDRPVSDANNSDSDFTPSIKEEEEEALESKPKTKKRIAKSTASRAKKPKVEAPETSTQSNVSNAQNFQQISNVSLAKFSNKIIIKKTQLKPVNCKLMVKKVNGKLLIVNPIIMEKQLQKLNTPCDTAVKEINDKTLIKTSSTDIEKQLQKLDMPLYVTAKKVNKKTLIKTSTMDMKSPLQKLNTPCDMTAKKLNYKTLITTPKMDMEKQLQNLNTILQSTNATPIRCQGRSGYRCGYCNDEYQKAEDLKNHTLEHHDPVTQKLLFSLNPNAYLIKLDITSLKCNLCFTTCTTLEEIMQHLEETHGKIVHFNINNHIMPFKFDSKPLKCVLCPKTDEFFRNLLLHMNVHYRNYMCECGATCVTERALKNHKKTTHPGVQAEYACRICTKVFINSRKRANHEYRFHVKNGKSSKCDYCNKSLTNSTYKRKHMEEVHGMESLKFQCNSCDKVYWSATKMNIHIRRDHLLERKYDCTICEKKFFTKQNLQLHMLTHPNVNKFICEICSKAFFENCQLQQHMFNIHRRSNKKNSNSAKEKRFKCEHCGLRFLRLKSHVRFKHEERINI